MNISARSQRPSTAVEYRRLKRNFWCCWGEGEMWGFNGCWDQGCVGIGGQVGMQFQIGGGCGLGVESGSLCMTLTHGCARVAHCVTARWRNFSHYCRPLRHYDVWLRVLITEKHWQQCRQHTVYRNKRLEFATELIGKLRHSSGWGTEAFPLSRVICAPVH